MTELGLELASILWWLWGGARGKESHCHLKSLEADITKTQSCAGQNKCPLDRGPVPGAERWTVGGRPALVDDLQPLTFHPAERILLLAEEADAVRRVEGAVGFH